jgi:hypothetical protein
MQKTIVVLEHIWNDDPIPHNKDLSVLPYIDGVSRLRNYELFYGKYVDGTGFNSWVKRYKEILQDRNRRIILYLAGHGSHRTLGGKQLNPLLSEIWGAANHLNIEGCILGGCFVGKNIGDIKNWMTESNLTWVIGYQYEIDWLPSTLFDINIISSTLSCRQDTLADRNKLEDLLKNAASLFNPIAEIATDKDSQRKDFTNTVTCVIQPRGPGYKPVSVPLF